MFCLIFHVVFLLFVRQFCCADFIKTERNGKTVYSNIGKTDPPLVQHKEESIGSAALNMTKYNHYIENYCSYYGVNPVLVRAIIQTESNFNPLAVSSKGAMGLMQLMPDTAKIYEVKDPFEPGENILAGIKHICVLKKRYNDNLSLVLAAYNAGDTAVAKYGGIPPFQETKDYVKKVMGLYEGNNSSVKKKTIYSKKNENGKTVYSNVITGD